MPVTWSDGTHERTEICDLMVLPANSNHDILLGREGIARFNANASTVHAMVGFPTRTGIAFIRGNKDCHSAETAKPPKMVKTDARTEPEKWVQNPKFPEQTVVIGHVISDTIHNHLKQLLIRNMDVFAWQPADMVGVPRDIAEHKLSVYRSVEPVVQKK